MCKVEVKGESDELTNSISNDAKENLNSENNENIENNPSQPTISRVMLVNTYNNFKNYMNKNRGNLPNLNKFSKKILTVTRERYNSGRHDRKFLVYIKELFSLLLTKIIQPAISRSIQIRSNSSIILYDDINLSLKSRRFLGRVQKKTLVLDLDETLIKCTTEDPNRCGYNTSRNHNIYNRLYQNNPKKQNMTNYSSYYRNAELSRSEMLRSGLFYSWYMFYCNFCRFISGNWKNTENEFKLKSAIELQNSDNCSKSSNKRNSNSIYFYTVMLKNIITLMSIRIFNFTWYNTLYTCTICINKTRNSWMANYIANALYPVNEKDKTEFRILMNMQQRTVQLNIKMRPYVKIFLRKVSKWYDVVIFTAAIENYASAVCDKLEEHAGLKLEKRFYRQHCDTISLSPMKFTKDISKVSPDLANILIIDNSEIAYKYFPDNAIPINDYMGDLTPNDDSLLGLLPMLDCLRFTSDVRNILYRYNANNCYKNARNNKG